jgi:hypothetical protein
MKKLVRWILRQHSKALARSSFERREERWIIWGPMPQMLRGNSVAGNTFLEPAETYPQSVARSLCNRIARHFRRWITCRIRSWLGHRPRRFIGRVARWIVRRLARRVLCGRSYRIVQRVRNRLLRISWQDVFLATDESRTTPWS